MRNDKKIPRILTLSATARHQRSRLGSLHYGGQQGAKPKAEIIADMLARIKERRAKKWLAM